MDQKIGHGVEQEAKRAENFARRAGQSKGFRMANAGRAEQMIKSNYAQKVDMSKALERYMAISTATFQRGRMTPKETAQEYPYLGLYHFAILYPSRKELAKAVKKLVAAHYPLEGAADHGVSEAIYLRDPDNNGVELYVDRPRSDWKKSPTGEILMATEPLDLESLMGELEK